MKYGLPIIMLCILIPPLLLAQADSTATDQKTQQIFLSGGYSFPYLPQEFKDNFKSGSNFGAGYGYQYAAGDVGYSKLYLTVEYNLYKFNEQGFLNRVAQTSDSSIVQNNPGFTAYQHPTKILTATVNYQGTFTGLSKYISPFFTLGIGYLYIAVPALVTTPSSSLNSDAWQRSAVTWSAGVGLDAPITESVGVFVQGRMFLGLGFPDETRQYFPVTLGVHYTP